MESNKNKKQQLYSKIAQSADLLMKPFIHSIVDKNIKEDNSIFECEELLFNIECRTKEGKRLNEYDLEIEIFRSGKDINLMLSFIYYPDKPILWMGKHSVWMNSKTGVKCGPPNDGFKIEGLARKLLTFFDDN